MRFIRVRSLQQLVGTQCGVVVPSLRSWRSRPVAAVPLALLLLLALLWLLVGGGLQVLVHDFHTAAPVSHPRPDPSGVVAAPPGTRTAELVSAQSRRSGLRHASFPTPRPGPSSIVCPACQHGQVPSVRQPTTGRRPARPMRHAGLCRNPRDAGCATLSFPHEHYEDPAHGSMDILDVLTNSPPDNPAWGPQLCEQTGYGTGTIYPALDRLLQAGLIEDRWEDRHRMTGPAVVTTRSLPTAAPHTTKRSGSARLAVRHGRGPLYVPEGQHDRGGHTRPRRRCRRRTASIRRSARHPRLCPH